MNRSGDLGSIQTSACTDIFDNRLEICQTWSLLAAWLKGEPVGLHRLGKHGPHWLTVIILLIFNMYLFLLIAAFTFCCGLFFSLFFIAGESASNVSKITYSAGNNAWLKCNCWLCCNFILKYKSTLFQSVLKTSACLCLSNLRKKKVFGLGSCPAVHSGCKDMPLLIRCNLSTAETKSPVFFVLWKNAFKANLKRLIGRLRETKSKVKYFQYQITSFTLPRCKRGNVVLNRL